VSAYTERLTAARDAALDLLIALRTSHKPTYTVNGQTVSWTEYAKLLTEEARSYNALLEEAQATEEPFEIHSQGIT